MLQTVIKKNTCIALSRTSAQATAARYEPDADGARMDKSEKIEKLLELLKQLRKTEFTGSLTINFSQGGIGRIEKYEEVRLKKAIEAK
jgi:hypothetical protein